MPGKNFQHAREKAVGHSGEKSSVVSRRDGRPEVLPNAALQPCWEPRIPFLPYEWQSFPLPRSGGRCPPHPREKWPFPDRLPNGELAAIRPTGRSFLPSKIFPDRHLILDSQNSRVYITLHIAAVAQLDRATGYEPVGREFESLQPHQIFQGLTKFFRESFSFGSPFCPSPVPPFRRMEKFCAVLRERRNTTFFLTHFPYLTVPFSNLIKQLF